MTLDFQVLAWDRHKNVAMLNRLMGFQHSPEEILIKLAIVLKISKSSLNTDNIHMDSAISWSMSVCFALSYIFI